MEAMLHDDAGEVKDEKLVVMRKGNSKTAESLPGAGKLPDSGSSSFCTEMRFTSDEKWDGGMVGCYSDF